MKRIISVMEITYEALTKRDWDAVYIIDGPEGKGKSTLALHILDWWVTQQNGVCAAKDVKHMCLDSSQFVEDLKDMKKYEMTVFDEAGIMGSRSSMSKFNRIVMQAYQIIRGDNLCTILILPSIFDIDGYFSKHRAKGLFHVYERGRCAFWDQMKLRKIIALNQNRIIKSQRVVKPAFYDTYPIYKGVLKEPYAKKKKDKMQGVRIGLFDEFIKDSTSKKSESKLSTRDKMIVDMCTKATAAEVAKLVGLSERQIRRIIAKESDK